MGETASVERATLLKAWFGRDLRVAEANADHEHFAALPEEERVQVLRAVPTRQAEFATARMHARVLLAELGHPCEAILAGPDRAPRWPDSIEASVTHTNGQCLVVARSRAALGLGVDWEHQDRLPRAYWAGVLTADEVARIDAKPDAELRAMQSFSVKEALFKAMHTCGNESLDFLAIEVAAPTEPSTQPWSLRLLADFARRLPIGAEPRAWSTALQTGGVLSAAEVRV